MLYANASLCIGVIFIASIYTSTQAYSPLSCTKKIINITKVLKLHTNVIYTFVNFNQKTNSVFFVMHF